jgi:proline racemase
MLSDRKELEQRWLRLTRETLPALASERGWPVRYDHCFQRILLDNAFGGTWYAHVEGRPAYAKAPDDALARAVTLGNACVAGTADLAELNRQSLAWRRT